MTLIEAQRVAFAIVDACRPIQGIVGKLQAYGQLARTAKCMNARLPRFTFKVDEQRQHVIVTDAETGVRASIDVEYE